MRAWWLVVVDALWDERRMTASLVDEVLHRPRVPIETRSFPTSPGVYLLMMESDLPLGSLYEPLAGCVWPVYVGVGRSSVRRRLGRHRGHLAEIPNLRRTRFRAVTLTMTTSASAAMAEALLIEQFQPAWNLVLPGLTSSRQGANREEQRVSKHSVLHPGPHIGRGESKHSRRVLTGDVRRHLRHTVPRGGGWPTL